MRDPMSWAIPVFRAFGIPVKVHIFFFIITIGLFPRQVLQERNIVWWGDILLFTVVLLFGIPFLTGYSPLADILGPSVRWLVHLFTGVS